MAGRSAAVAGLSWVLPLASTLTVMAGAILTPVLVAIRLGLGPLTPRLA
ncbi:hypothetical protein [Salinispora fenicalii]|nr:hypothetical protein [Salinispora fenicalii]